MARAAIRMVLLATTLEAAGCTGQYADEGSIDMTAAKEAAARNGIEKFSPSPTKKPTRRGTSHRGPIVTDDKPMMPHRGSIPK